MCKACVHMCTSVEKERHYEKIMSCLPNTNGTDKPRWEMCREELPCVFRNYTILELERNLAVTRASIGGSPHCFVERKSIREPIQFYLNSDSDLYQPCDFVWVWLNLSRLHFYLTFVGDGRLNVVLEGPDASSLIYSLGSLEKNHCSSQCSHSCFS